MSGIDTTVPRIVLIGATGRTGNAVAHALAARDDIVLAAVVAPSVATSPTRPLPSGVPAFASLSEVDIAADTVVDLGVAEAVPAHAALARARGQHVVIGATGFDVTAVEQLADDAASSGLGVLVVPNFSIGAVLMMQFAERAAKYLPDAAIVETHHATKLDAPSGTAVRTAQLVAGSQGTDVEGVPVHSLRLAGATAHQDVIFSGPGEILTIRHDAIDRSCYASGVVLAARQVASCPGLNIGMEL